MSYLILQFACDDFNDNITNLRILIIKQKLQIIDQTIFNYSTSKQFISQSSISLLVKIVMGIHQSTQLNGRSINQTYERQNLIGQFSQTPTQATPHKTFQPILKNQYSSYSQNASGLRWVEQQNLRQIPGLPTLVTAYYKYSTLRRPETPIKQQIQKPLLSLKKDLRSIHKSKEQIKSQDKLQKEAIRQNNKLENSHSFLHQCVEGQLYKSLHKFDIQSTQAFQNIQNYMLRKSVYCRQLVSVLDFSVQQLRQSQKSQELQNNLTKISEPLKDAQNTIGLCREYYQKRPVIIITKVITERVPYRLSRLSELVKFSFQQVIFMLVQILQAYDLLEKVNIYSKCTIQKVGFTKKGHVKFWVNKVYGRTQVQEKNAQTKRLGHAQILMSIFQTMLKVIQQRQLNSLANLLPQLQINQGGLIKARLMNKSFEQTKQEHFFSLIIQLILKDHNQKAKNGQKKLIDTILNFQKGIYNRYSLRNQIIAQRGIHSRKLCQKRTSISDSSNDFRIRFFIGDSLQRSHFSNPHKHSLSKNKFKQPRKAINLIGSKKQQKQNVDYDTQKYGNNQNAKNINDLRSIRQQCNTQNYLKKNQSSSKFKQIHLKGVQSLSNANQNKTIIGGSTENFSECRSQYQRSVSKNGKISIRQKSRFKNQRQQQKEQNRNLFVQSQKLSSNKTAFFKDSQNLAINITQVQSLEQKRNHEPNLIQIHRQSLSLKRQEMRVEPNSFLQTPKSRMANSSSSSNIYTRIDSQQSTRHINVAKSKVESTLNGSNEKSYTNSVINAANSMFLRSSFNAYGSSTHLSINLANNVMRKPFDDIDSKKESLNSFNNGNFIFIKQSTLQPDKICESKNQLKVEQQDESSEEYTKKRMKTEQINQKRQKDKQNCMSCLSENKPLFSERKIDKQIQVEQSEKAHTMQINIHHFSKKIQNLSSRKSLTVSVLDEQENSDKESIIIISARNLVVSPKSSFKAQKTQKPNSSTAKPSATKRQIYVQQNQTRNCFAPYSDSQSDAQNHETPYLRKKNSSHESPKRVQKGIKFIKKIIDSEDGHSILSSRNDGEAQSSQILNKNFYIIKQNPT